jgi:ribosomal-protein-alanine acetyltransferase
MLKSFPQNNYPAKFLLVRSATLADITIIMALSSQSPTAPQWTREHYEQAIQVAQPRRVLLVLEDQKKIVGFLVARVVSNEWELENIVVAVESRRRSLGSAVLSEFLGVARQENAASVFLEVRESNHSARAFYEKWAFKETGRRPNYYDDPKEDAILYCLTLS